MKTISTRLLLASVLGLSAAGVLPAASAQPDKTAKPDPRVEVIFDHPENFTDAKQDFQGTDSGRENILTMFREFLQERGAELLPPGQKLLLTFTDIDLAGDFEPWRGPRWDEIRVVKDIYPPRFIFTYKLTDDKGQVLKQDKVDLRDLSFMMRLTIDRQDSLHFEKDILNDWLRETLRPPKA
jgi:hypothetical protein